MKNSPFSFQDYELEEIFAEGAGGTFYRVFRQADYLGRGRHFSLYRARPEIASNVNAVDSLRERLKVAEGLAHPNLSPTLAAESGSEGLFVLSDWVPGTSLSLLSKQIHSSGGQWPAEAVLYLAGELAACLCYLHKYPDPITGQSRELVHGQVRPENVWISFSGQVRLTCLGVADLESFAVAEVGGFREGLSNYASPEQAIGQSIDGRSDFFSLGALLWELLAGKPLFEACSREEWLKLVTGRVSPSLSQASDKIPIELDAVIGRLLNPDLFQRYELGEKLVRDISAVLSFRFPKYAASDFILFCQQNLQAQIEAHKKESLIEATPAEVTKAIEQAAPAKPSPPVHSPAPPPVAAPVFYQAAKVGESKSSEGGVSQYSKARAERVKDWTKESSPGAGSSFFTQGFVKNSLVVLGVLLLLSPVLGPKVIRKYREKMKLGSTAQKQPEAKLDATLTVISNERDFSLKINGAAVALVNGRVSVPSGKALLIQAQKYGFSNIETEYQLMSGEVLEIPLNFIASQVSGKIDVFTEPAADIKIYHGTKLMAEGRSPLPETSLPVGSYRVEILSEIDNYKDEVSVEILEGETLHLGRKQKP